MITLADGALTTKAQNGTKNVPIGKTIALLAQEGDDISNLEVPPEEPKAASSSASSSSSTPSSSAPQPPSSPPSSSSPSESSSHKGQLSHDRPFFPSVLRLLEENNISDAGPIKGAVVSYIRCFLDSQFQVCGVQGRVFEACSQRATFSHISAKPAVQTGASRTTPPHRPSTSHKPSYRDPVLPRRRFAYSARAL